MTATHSLTVVRTIGASRERVFRAWLDADTLALFMRPIDDVCAASVTLDPVVGGSFEIVMSAHGEPIAHRGTYLTIDEFDRIAFTWESPFTAPGSTVTIDFAAISPTETELRLHHAGLIEPDARDNHETGWRRILVKLEEALA